MNSLSDQTDGAGDGPTNGGIQPGRYYGRSIPYLPINGYPGKLIAVEGTDSVGRSTQIQLLREWLEVKGYGVVETGWTRSELMQPTIELAKASNTLNKLTFVLLYATDFADRLVEEFDLEVIDASGTITEQQQLVRRLISPFLTPGLELPSDRPSLG